MKKLLYTLFYYLLLPFVFFGVILIPKRYNTMIWGCTPIINNKYWSNAVTQIGIPSITIMTTYYSINKKDDYDYYLDDFVPRWLINNTLRTILAPLYAFMYCINNASVMHISFNGGPLGNTPLWRIEASMYKRAGIKTIVIPFGSDGYQYSQVIDTSLRNALLISYPEAGKREKYIKKRVDYWVKNADVLVTGFMIDGLGRWDCTLESTLVIDTTEWNAKTNYSNADGKNDIVKIIHTPNHRGLKGTEFIINAVDELKKEGLKIELILLEGVSNSRVHELMQEIDILVEQLIFTGYAMSAIEGMASGLSVMSNLDHEAYTRIFRRYAYLDECPILSTTPENIIKNLRILVTNPQLREELGRAGRHYVEKYHSYETAQYIFGSIYDKILYGKDVDLINLFHPLKSEYNQRRPYVKHPLKENELPEEYS